MGGYYGWFPAPLVGRGEGDAPDADLTLKLAEAKKSYGSGLDMLIERTAKQLYYEYDKANYPFGGSRAEGINKFRPLPNFSRLAQLKVIGGIAPTGNRTGGAGLRGAYNQSRGPTR